MGEELGFLLHVVLLNDVIFVEFLSFLSAILLVIWQGNHVPSMMFSIQVCESKKAMTTVDAWGNNVGLPLPS